MRTLFKSNQTDQIERGSRGDASNDNFIRNRFDLECEAIKLKGNEFVLHRICFSRMISRVNEIAFEILRWMMRVTLNETPVEHWIFNRLNRLNRN
jgi:hypothetical protein